MAVRAPEFWHQGAGWAPRLLAPLAWGYGAGVAARQWWTTPATAPVPVICVGNVVTGGAGKTPVALALAAHLAAKDIEAHFLSRGYGGGEAGPLSVDPRRHDYRDVGDEALLLAARAPCWVAQDRAAGAEAAALGADVIILDDGLQNPGLAKDISFVVIDGGYGLGNGRLLPAGPLRETLGAALGRAHGVVVVGQDRAGIAQAVADAQDPTRQVPILHARLQPGDEAAALAGQPVVAFAGIGRPGKFFDTLADIGCSIAAERTFADHHPYEADEIMDICELADTLGARVVTTAKDFVRLPEDAKPMVKVLSVELIWDDVAALDKVLGPVLGPVINNG